VFENVTNSMVVLLDNGKGWGQILNTVNERKANWMIISGIKHYIW
jgi:hypothetical protein